MKNTNFFKFLKEKSTIRFFLLLCVPIFIVAVFLYAGSLYYVSSYTELISSSYTNELNRFMKTLESELSQISTDSSILMSSPDIKYALDTNDSPDNLDNDKILTSKKLIRELHTSNSFIESIAIVNRTSNFVVTLSGTYTIDQYFNNITKYSDYNTNFWKDFPPTGTSNKILSPTEISYVSGIEPTPVVPAIFSSIGATNSGYIIFNISSTTIYEQLSSYSFTKNSQFFMIDAKTGKVISSEYKEPFFTEDELTSKLKDFEYYYLGDLELSGEKYLTITSPKHSSLFGYSYIAVIPYSDIEIRAYDVYKYLIPATLLLIIIMLLYAWLGSRRLSTPWKSLAQKLNAESKEIDKGDIVSYINEAITNILTKNDDLSRNLAVSLPLSQQKYLVDILNNPNFAEDKELNGLIFKNEYFVSIAVSVSIYTSQLDPSIPATIQLHNELYRAIESMFASKFNTITMPNNSNALYLLLNVESDNDEIKHEISQIIEKVKQLFAEDANYLDLFIGEGKIYRGIDGLRMSHQEAISELFKTMNADKVKIFDNTQLKEYSFNINNENILVNYMVGGYGDKAKTLIKDVFEKCANTSHENKQQAYTSLFNALSKVLHLKNVRHPDFSIKSDIELLHSLLSKDDDYIKKYLLDLVDSISIENVSTSKLDIVAVADYIQAHYTENIYLDNLAQIFNTSPKYLSKRLGQHLGISFKDYLTQLRLSKAEELIKETDMKINELCKEVGFYNHSTFIRAFKQKTGISPSEYRSLYKNKTKQ